jgi:hypothetical protein
VTTAQADVLAAETASRPPVLWRRSAKGNLTRRIGRLHVTVFLHYGSWRWALTDAGTDQVRYSTRGYPTEDAAIDAVLTAVRKG